jgi:predicted nucleic acid-binding protein
MVVVSDTSPLTNLAAIGQLDILRQMFGTLLIPEAVWSELGHGGVAWPGRDEVQAAP